MFRRFGPLEQLLCCLESNLGCWSWFEDYGYKISINILILLPTNICSSKCKLWHDDIMALWHNDTMTPWHNDTMTQWHDDTITWWNEDLMICWYDDMMTWWHDDMIPVIHIKITISSISSIIENSYKQLHSPIFSSVSCSILHPTWR